MKRKSLKRYRGGVDTNQVVGQSLEGTTQEENPVTNLTQGEDLGFPPNQVTSNEDLSPPPPIDESLDPKKVEDLSPPPPIGESLSPDLAKKPDILASSLEDLPQAQEIPVVEAVPVEGTDPDIEQKLKIADAATNLVKLINTNDILIPQNAEISVGLAAEQIPIQIEEETKAAIDTKETTDLRPVGLIGGRNRKFKLTKKRRVK